jgi:hypothetical protein
MQTQFTSKDQSVHGNCFAACVASLLELPLEAMPSFLSEDWCSNLFSLLKEHGYDFGGSFYPEGADWWPRLQALSPGVDGYYIAGGPSPREWVKRGHAVIYKDGVMVHDPHPSGAGILSVGHVLMIEKEGENDGR